MFITPWKCFFLAVIAAGAIACGSDDDATTTATTSTSTTSSGAGGGGSCVSAMYGKYGAAAFTKVTNDLVMTAASDATVGHYFSVLSTPAQVTEFEKSLDQFLVSVYGGPNDYTGPDMASAHTGLGITSADYDYFVGLIVQTLTADGVSTDDIDNCFAGPVTDATFKASIVGK